MTTDSSTPGNGQVGFVDRIEGLIVKETEDLFEGEQDRDTLRNSIRIAYEFHEFLESFGNAPPLDEVNYVIGTIRSGIDDFFTLAHRCVIIDTDRSTWAFEKDPQWSFPRLRTTFFNHFKTLKAAETKAVDRLASLLVLIHLQLMFLSWHFPWTIIDAIP